MTISTADLERIEQACRALADRYCRDTEVQAGNSVRDIALRSQSSCASPIG
jgi:hypothetical protein